MKINTLLLCFLFSKSFALCAQETEIIYFDKDWKKIAKDSGTYSWLCKMIKKDSLYFASYFNKDENLHMTGQYTDHCRCTRTGTFAWFDLSGDTTSAELYTKGCVDSIYYYKNGKRLPKDQHVVPYRHVELRDSLYSLTSYYPKGRKSMQGQFSDCKLKTRTGLFIWFSKNGDTTSTELYEKGRVTTITSFENGKRFDREVLVNDSTKYTNSYSHHKETDKRLYAGRKEYLFKDNDSIWNFRNYKYTFTGKWPFVNVIGIKWKILPYAIGDDGGMFYTLGLEYSFRFKHSLELTANYVDYDSAPEDSVGNNLPSIYTVRRSLQLGYRYYFKSVGEQYKIYVSPFLRFAKWQDFYSQGAPTDFTKNEMWDYGGGALIGISTWGGDRGYVDMFAGPQYIFRYHETQVESNQVTINTKEWQNRFSLRVGFNFSYLFFRKSDKTK